MLAQGRARVCSRNQHAWGREEGSIRESLGDLHEAISVLAQI